MKKTNQLWKKLATVAIGAFLTIGAGVSVLSFGNAFEKANAADEAYDGGYYLTGIDSWTLDRKPDFQLKRLGISSVYQWTGFIAVNSEFKLNIDGTWGSIKDYTHLSGVCKTDGSMDGVGGNNIRVVTSHNFKISYNTLTGDFDAGYNNDQYYLVGVSGWGLDNTDYPLTNIGGTIFQWVGTLAVNVEFKLNTSGGWAGVVAYDGLSGSSKTDGTIVESGWYETFSGSGVWKCDHNMKIAVAKEIRITFDSSTGLLAAEPDDTKRVWLDTSDVSWWDGDLENALVGVFYWGGSLSTAWAGVEMKYDNANSLWFYDVQSDVTSVKFTRIDADNRSVDFNKSIDVELPLDPNNSKFELAESVTGIEQNGTIASFSPTAPTVVLNFAATIDTQAEACNAPAVEMAIAIYHCLSTYEQNAFNNYSFGSPLRTGAQTLAYLEAYFSVVDPLGNNGLGTITNRNIAIVIIVSGFGLVAVVGLYFINRKRKTSRI